MNKPHLSNVLAGIALASLLAAATNPAEAKNSLKIIYKAVDSDGNLIGIHGNPDGTVLVVTDAGPTGDGQILQLTPSGNSYSVTPVKVFNQEDQDGVNPSPYLVADANGVLWGFTINGNQYSDGTLFKLTEKSGIWSLQTVLAMPTGLNFGGTIGTHFDRSVFDDEGNLIGLAVKGSVDTGCDQDGCGRIFEIPAALMNGTAPSGRTKKPKVKMLYTISGFVGYGLARDKKGNLFGYGPSGTTGNGNLWEVKPPKRPNGAWTGGVIWNFCNLEHCADGTAPDGIPAVDAHGTLLGTSYYNGYNDQNLNNQGVAWAFSPNGKDGGSIGILHTFADNGDCPGLPQNGIDHPFGNAVLDPKGQMLFYTSTGGYRCSDGGYFDGGVISVNPKKNTFKVVSNKFGTYQGNVQAKGAITPAAGPDLVGTTIYGTSQAYWNAETQSLERGVVFKLTE
jgi:hypothetical protein